ncbi:MAG: hypothetical protein MUC37_12745 [Hyphomicrobium sp.]|jgi:hypothetical protein|nr:hypothetical protein [Hyphomicrobium sp.]
MTGWLLKGLALFLAAAVAGVLLTYAVPVKLVPVVRVAVWALPFVFLGIELWASAAAHDFDGAAIWRSIVSAGAQTLLFWPGALAGHYAAAALRAGTGAPGGKT